MDATGLVVLANFALHPFDYYVGHSLGIKTTCVGFRSDKSTVLSDFVAGAAATADDKVRTSLPAQFDSGAYISVNSLELSILR